MKYTNLLNSIAILALVGAVIFTAIQLHFLTVRISNTETAVEQSTLSYEEQLNVLGASLAISEPVPLFEDALASRIDDDDTSFTLISGLDKTGTSLASSTYGFILSEGSANEEFVLADCTGTTCTNVERGYWPLTQATSTALAKSHRRGDTVKITDSPIINELKRIINGQDAFPNALTFDGKLTYTAQPTLTSTLDIPYKSYVDDSVNQGAATSSEATGGILEIATATEAASTTTDLPNRPLALTTGIATSSPDQTNTGPLVVVSQINRKISQLWLDLTESFTWTGEHTFNGGGTATTTFNRGVDIDADTDTPLILNLLSYIFPSTHTASSSALMNDGSGGLSWNLIDAFYRSMSAGNFAIDGVEAVHVHSDGNVYPTNALVASNAEGFVGFTSSSGVATSSSGNIVMGGIVSGLSGLTSGQRYYIQDATNSASINQTSTDDSSAISTSETAYQSFTVGSDDIVVIAVRADIQGVGSSPSITPRIRTGEGTGGSLVATGIAVTMGGNADQVFYFDVPVLLSASTQYSLTLQRSGGAGTETWFSDTGNPYAGGRSEESASHDTDFSIYVEGATTLGAIGTSAGTNSREVGVAISATELLITDN